jgi:hypothetical protein
MSQIQPPHPAVLALAVELILHPERRSRHSEVVLMLVDHAIEIIKESLQVHPNV